MCDIAELINACGSTNPPGVKVKTWWVASEDIDIFPPFLTTANPGDSVTLDGVITLLPNKAFKRIDIVSQSGEVKDTMVGGVGSKSFENTLDMIIPKTNAEQLEFINCMANSCPIVIVEDKAGVMRVLGTKDDPAYIESAETTTGKASGDTRGITMQVKSTVGTVAPVYTGTIDLDPLT